MNAMEPVIPLRRLGRSGVGVPALGVGTNRWGRGRGADQLAPVFSAALDAGANLIDTAEVYLGSEKTIGECLRRDPRPALLVTKFAPYPTRLSARSFHKALEGSLARLGRDSVDLYLIHFPFSVVGIPSLMDRLAEVVQGGKARAVGVSNFSARQMHIAAERLDRHGVPLAANEVQFSVFHRDPERNGVLAACRDLDVALIAYRPLAGGPDPAGRYGARQCAWPNRPRAREDCGPGRAQLAAWEGRTDRRHSRNHQRRAPARECRGRRLDA